MYLKQPLWDGVGHIIEEEQTTELMYSDQGGNICFFYEPFEFNYEPFFSSSLWSGAVDKRGASEGGRIRLTGLEKSNRLKSLS